MSYLAGNLDSLIDYRAWQQAGWRISTGFVESSINRIVGRRMCKSQHMRWSRIGAHNIVQVRVALLNNELDGLARKHFPWIGQRRVSWPWQQPSRGFLTASLNIKPERDCVWLAKPQASMHVPYSAGRRVAPGRWSAK